MSAVALASALVVGLGWAARDEAGSAWLVSHLPGVTVTAPRGTLLGDFDARRVVVQLGGQDQIVFTGLVWRGLHLSASAQPSLWARLSMTELRASRIDLLFTPSDAPLTPPTRLHLPVQIDIDSLQIGALHATALGDTPLRDLRARVQLGAAHGAEHRTEALSATWGRLQAQGSARIETRAPFTLDARLEVTQTAQVPAPAASPASPHSVAPPIAASLDLTGWQARLALRGPLSAPRLNASVQSPATATHPAQALTAEAGLRPFAAWPLAELRAQAQALDLSALSPAAPITAWTGQVTVHSTAANRPMTAEIALNNERAGRWSDGFVPLRRLQAALVTRADDPSTVALNTFDAEFGTRTQAAGRLSGRGHWAAAQASLTATLHALQPALLDARAPAMQIGGPLSLTLTQPPAAAASAASSASSTVAAASTTALPLWALKLDLTGALLQAMGAGQIDTAGKTVQLTVDATATAQHLQLRELRARTGGALATLAGSAQRLTTADAWQVQGRAALVDFDPLPWWPGHTDSPWRRGLNRINATGEFDLAVPAAPHAPLTAWRGNAQLRVAHSMVAGAPVEGNATLRSQGSGMADATLALQVADNRLQVQGRFSTVFNPASGAKLSAQATHDNVPPDHWSASVEAPTLATLEPLWRLLQPTGADATLAGALRASATLDGRWPALTTQGELNANGLRLGAVAVQEARAQWLAGTAGDAALNIEANLSQLRIHSAPSATAPSSPAATRTANVSTGLPGLESARLQITGMLNQHQVELRGQSKALPPAWTDALQAPAPSASGAPVTDGTPARSTWWLQARGGAVEAAGQPLAGWRGSVQQLALNAGHGRTAPWLRASDLSLEALWSGGPARVSVQPGRADVLGATLRWNALRWQADGGVASPARVDAELAFDPLPIAPVLARLQPGFGWGGDLTMGGHLEVHSDGGLSANVVLERHQGDLTVTDEVGTQSLGLTNLRVALSAEDGVWTFSHYLNGKTLGVLAGAVIVRTAPEALWPTPDATVQGAAELDVANLGAWGTWVPAGWRLGGQMKTSAVFSGRFGAPEVTGRIQGSALSVRNFVEGVNVSDGDVLISLQGSTARIERFTARGGNGSLRISGTAALGDSPNAQLQLQADRFMLLGRVDRRILTSGHAQLDLGRDSVGVQGAFAVDEGLIDFTRSDAPALSNDVQVVRPAGNAAPREADATPPASEGSPALSGPPRNVTLDLKIALGHKLRLRGRGIETGLRGDLRLTAPGGRLAIQGTVTTAGGTYAAYGQKLTIDRGQITFNGPPDNPQLNIEASRPNLDIRAGVQISGTAQNPRIRLFSEPEMSEVDKLSWLVLGRASDGLGGGDTALLQTAAMALLAGEGDSLTDQFTKAIGLDELTLKQNQGEVRDTVISLGKQLSRRWYVGYERGLNATAGSFQLVYRIARSFTLRAQSGFENSLDVIWTWRWG